MSVRVNTSGHKLAMDRIVMVSLAFIDFAYKAAREGIENFYMKALREEIMLEDHSLAMLRMLGHPYGRKSNPGGINTGALGHEAEKVHQQTTGLFPSMELKPTKGIDFIKREMIAAATRTGGETRRQGPDIKSVSFRPSALGSLSFGFEVISSSKITAYVFFGTKRMWPRDFSGPPMASSYPQVQAYIQDQVRSRRRT